jgi:hypothetical protein
MTEELSEADTSDEEKKTAHRELLKTKVALDADEEDVAIWEVVHPDFQSKAVSTLARR